METFPTSYEGAERDAAQTPVYIYVVKHTSDGVSNYWTNHERDLVVVNLPASVGSNPQTFTSANCLHGQRELTNAYEIQDGEFRIQVYADRLAKALYINQPRHIYVTVYRVLASLEPGDVVDFTSQVLLAQSGIAQKVGMVGQVAIATTKPPHLMQDRYVPRVWSSRQCNWKLGDPLTCKVNMASFNWATTISALSRGTRRVTLTGQRPSSSADFFAAGYMSHAASGFDAGIEHSEFDGSNTRITVTSWNPEWLVGHSVTLFAGCQHTKAACVTKFNNLANFGGFANLPQRAIHLHGVR